MLSFVRDRHLFGVVMAAAAGLAATPSLAQSQQENMAAQEAHARAMNDIAATAPYSPDDGGDYEDENGYGNDGAPGVGSNPLHSSMADMARFAQVQIDRLEIESELLNDPRYLVFRDGGWEFFQNIQNAQPGEYCVALYQRGQNMIAVTGPGGGYSTAMVLFIGPQVPTPPTFRRVRATLSQNDAPPVTVDTFLFREDPGARGVGTIAFTVPSADALLEGMADVLEIGVTLEGREVFRQGWTGGSAAREQLRFCLEG